MNDHNPSIPTAPSIPAPAVTVEPNGQSGISSEQAATMAEWAKQDLLSGKITPAQAEQQFNELNVPMEQRGPDVRTDEEKELDRAYPIAKAHEYTVLYHGVPPSPTVTQFDATARGWMVAAGLPVNIGNSLAKAITHALQATEGMTESQIEQRGFDQFDMLQRLPHGGLLDERLKSVNHMVHAIEATHPGVYRFLTSHGIADDAMVMNILMNHAPIYHARRKGR